MASVIKLKRSSTPGATPSASDLEVGEVALNLADRVIYSKQAGGAVVRIGEAALANTNAFITSVQTAERSALANTNTRLAALESGGSGALSDRIDLVNTNLTSTNTALRTLITTNATDITTQTNRINLLNTNLTATNTAIRNLNTATQSALDTQEAKQASDLANTNTSIAAQAARIDLVNTNLTATNTAIRNLNTATQSALDTQEAKQAADLANTNAFIASVQASAGGGLGNTNLAIAQLNTNLLATNTAIRNLNTATQSALDTQEAKQASNLANTNTFIAAVQSAERAALANTNTRIDNLSTTLTGDFLTIADPAPTGHLNHTGRASISTNLTVGGNTHIDGNLTVEGEVTYISTTTLEVMDPLIKLASNNQTDVVDTGFYALYDEGSTSKYAGIFRDATDGIFKVFKDLQADPTVTVDTGGTGYAQGQLDAIIDGGSF
tara:strand:- start:6931 stop:8250 length:1320 start_codon:yes stop_codon:yes gene_type:complete